MNELVSIIVPIYNVEQYLDQCIESLVKQTYTNIEIILVNDGSEDGSGDICEKWKLKDNRIKVIHKQNGGQSDARNRGISCATGTFFAFVDSDDFITEDCIDILLSSLKSNQADIACARITKYYDGIPAKNLHKSSTTDVWNSAEAIENMLYEHNITSSVYVKLYKREIFNNILFPIGKLYEDLYIMYKLFYKSKKIAISKDVVYYYRIRSDSTVGQLDPRRNKDLLIASENILKFIKTNMPSLVIAGEYKVFFAAMELFVHYPEDDKLEKKDLQEMNELWKIIKSYRRQVLLDRNSSGKYRILALASYAGGKALRRFYKVVAFR